MKTMKTMKPIKTMKITNNKMHGGVSQLQSSINNSMSSIKNNTKNAMRVINNANFFKTIQNALSTPSVKLILLNLSKIMHESINKFGRSILNSGIYVFKSAPGIIEIISGIDYINNIYKTMILSKNTFMQTINLIKFFNQYIDSFYELLKILLLVANPIINTLITDISIILEKMLAKIGLSGINAGLNMIGIIPGIGEILEAIRVVENIIDAIIASSSGITDIISTISIGITNTINSFNKKVMDTTSISNRINLSKNDFLDVGNIQPIRNIIPEISFPELPTITFPQNPTEITNIKSKNVGGSNNQQKIKSSDIISRTNSNIQDFINS